LIQISNPTFFNKACNYDRQEITEEDIIHFIPELAESAFEFFDSNVGKVQL